MMASSLDGVIPGRASTRWRCTSGGAEATTTASASPSRSPSNSRGTSISATAAPEALARFGPALSLPRGLLKWALWSAAGALLLLAVSVPQGPAVKVEGRQPGADVILCVDVSSSMLAMDIQPNRLEALKAALTGLLDQLQGDRVGIVAFAGDPVVACPLTTDLDTAALFLQKLDIDSVPRDGTGLGPALQSALDDFKSDGSRGKLILLAYLTPSSLLFIPLSVLVAQLHLGNSLHGLVIVYMTFATPFSTWLLMGYFKGIPPDLEEQAMVDGTSQLGALFRILLPLSLPGLAAVAIFTFTAAWNELLFALIFITSEEKRTVPLGLQYLMTGDVLLWGPIMAGATLAALPVMLLYFIAQRFMVRGVTAGSVKG